MSIFKFANQAASTIAVDISPGSTSVQVAPGDGALFPSPGAGEVVPIYFLPSVGGTAYEVVYCTARSGDTLTITRAQEGTTAQSWSSGDLVVHGPTAGTQDNMMQVQQSQQGLPNYANDTGSVNAYAATLSPPVSTRIQGLTVRIKASASNTGNSTLNLGAGSVQIVNPDGSTLSANAIVSGGIFEIVDPGSGPYQLVSYNGQAASAAGAFTTGGVQWRPTSETLSGWVPANFLTIGNGLSNATNRANPDTSALFSWHWDNFSNTVCPVYDSTGAPVARGVNAAADFAANRQIATYDMRGTSIVGVDTMGGAATTRLTGVPVVTGATTTPGSIIGENLVTLTLSQIPAHQHAVYLKDNQHSHVYQQALTGITVAQGTFGAYAALAGVATTSNSSNITIGSVNGVANDNMTADNAGGGGSHNNVPRSATGYFYLKL